MLPGSRKTLIFLQDLQQRRQLSQEQALGFGGGGQFYGFGILVSRPQLPDEPGIDFVLLYIYNSLRETQFRGGGQVINCGQPS